MIEVEEILYHWCQGFGMKKIARSCGVSRNVARKLIQKASALGLERGVSWEVVQQTTAQLQAVSSKKVRFGYWIQHLPLYHAELEAWHQEPYMTVTQIVRLLQERGEQISETTLHRYLKKHFPKKPQGTVHLTTTPGTPSAS